jgi:hypothetical protein
MLLIILIIHRPLAEVSKYEYDDPLVNQRQRDKLIIRGAVSNTRGAPLNPRGLKMIILDDSIVKKILSNTRFPD